MARDIPQSESELLARARSLSGRTIEWVAQSIAWKTPDDQKRAKGFVGQLLEEILGATAGSRAKPDFPHIGVELKTIPVSETGKPLESTFVCTAPLDAPAKTDWSTSWVRAKLARVLWVPIVGKKSVPLGKRQIGTSFMWSPSTEDDICLGADWSDLAELVLASQFDRLTAHLGEALQIRPKASNAQQVTEATDINGDAILVGPKGFYLRPSFTEQIIRNVFNSSDKPQ